MAKRPRLWFWVGSLLVSASLPVVPWMYWAIRGSLRGEAFYRVMPTSYWKAQIGDRYRKLSCDDGRLWSDRSHDRFIWLCKPTTLDRWLKKSGLSHKGGFWIFPALHDGDPRSLPVLLELLREEDPESRCFALLGLQYCCEQPCARKVALPAIKAVALADPDPTTRQAAVDILENGDIIK